MSIYREQLIDMVSSWTREQISNLIVKLELRVTETNQLLSELRAIRKKMSKTTPDNGDRQG